jgi:ribosomal protein L11 methyltransferase
MSQVNYFNVSISCKLEDKDLETERLFAYGAENVSSAESAEGLYLTVLTQDPETIKNHYPDSKISPVENWEHKWVDDYEGGLLIPGVFIKPSDKLDISIPNYIDTVIELDPKAAFGDGRHATTRLCAKLMRSIYDTQTPASVLDIGTGTGILAILAEKWGSKKIDAVDIDPQSVQKTKENLARNACVITTTYEANIIQDCPAKTYDLVIANILTDVIEKSIDNIISACKKGGVIVFSGISKPRRASMLALFKNKGLDIETCIDMDGWLGIQATK